jgi:putative transcriptional regulator
MDNVNLTHHFLIAMPNMADPYFSKSLTYICEHNEQGALGLVLTRPVDLTLSALLEQIEIPVARPEIGAIQVHFGGPVQMDRGFVLHQPPGQWQSTLRVNDEIGLTTSKDILEAVARGEGPHKFFVTLGYAGWAPGQLEHEISLNAWLSVPADTTLMFDLPLDARFDAAMHLLGIDAINLSDDAGHA